jgi:hypothetical protein
MQKSVLFMADIYKRGVQAWNYLPHPAQVDVPNQKILFYIVVVQLYKAPVLKQGYVSASGRSLDYKLFIQRKKINNVKNCWLLAELLNVPPYVSKIITSSCACSFSVFSFSCE